MNRFILTEDERRNISKLHKSYITEEAVQDVAVQPGVFNQKVLDLQKHLITKFGLKIVPDGKLGPKTLAAVQAALQTKVSQPVTTTTTPAPTVINQNTNIKSDDGGDADNEAKPLTT